MKDRVEGKYSYFTSSGSKIIFSWTNILLVLLTKIVFINPLVLELDI